MNAFALFALALVAVLFAALARGLAYLVLWPFAVLLDARAERQEREVQERETQRMLEQWAAESARSFLQRRREQQRPIIQPHF